MVETKRYTMLDFCREPNLCRMMEMYLKMAWEGRPVWKLMNIDALKYVKWYRDVFSGDLIFEWE